MNNRAAYLYGHLCLWFGVANGWRFGTLWPLSPGWDSAFKYVSIALLAALLIGPERIAKWCRRRSRDARRDQ